MPMDKIKIIKKLLSILKYSNVKNMSYDDPEIVPFMNYNIKIIVLSGRFMKNFIGYLFLQLQIYQKVNG